jgi:cell wall-associated NlpC family hydrolase
MKSHPILFILIFTMSGLLSCNRNNNKPAYPELNSLIDSVRIRYVPDRRDDVYDISVSQRDGKPVLRGITSVPEAKTELLNRIGEIRPDVAASVCVLPDKDLGEYLYAVANVSVADLRTGAGYAAEMATQILLGMPVQLLQYKSGWYRAKTLEGYVAWIQRGTLTLMNQESFDEWKTAPRVIFTDDYGFAYETPDENRQRTSDLTFGNLLKWEGDNGRFYRVRYPDDRQADILKSQSRMFSDWKASIQQTEESILQKAFDLKGIPYSWGGTSVKAMDCFGVALVVMRLCRV